jgi:gamma-glutamyltranspeptidase
VNERRLSAEGSRWAIACPHASATRAGADAFEAGGNAVDAALAAATSLAVVYPASCGVGGDLFALVRSPDGSIAALNSSGAAPATIDVDAIRAERAGDGAEHGFRMPERGPHTVTVPGAVAGWSELVSLGARFDLTRALQPAIAFAEDGVPVASDLAGSISRRVDVWLSDPGMAAVFLPDGKPLAEGELLRQPALAETLRTLANDGRAAMYGGPIGARLAEHLRSLGETHTIADFEAHSTDVTEPVTRSYRGVDVSVVPPNSQGFALLEMLLAIERLGIEPDSTGGDAVTFANVLRLACLDRDAHLADPWRVDVPVDDLLGEANINRVARTATSEAPTEAAPVAGGTVGIVTADADGWAVSLIQSLYNGFGSGILEPSTGVVLHNRGACFSLDPASPNVIAGRKRPAHTLMPVLLTRDGQLVAVPGTMGGGGQPQIHAQVLTRSLDLGMSPAEAVAAPRYVVGGTDSVQGGAFVEAEERVPVETRQALADAGYRVDVLEPYDGSVGHTHLIRVGPDGFSAGSDPRADGSAEAG